MNQRINDLWTECVKERTKDPMNWPEVSRLFAECIIQECIAEVAMVGIQNFEDEGIQWAVERSITNIRNRFPFQFPKALNEQSN